MLRHLRNRSYTNTFILLGTYPRLLDEVCILIYDPLVHENAIRMLGREGSAFLEETFVLSKPKLKVSQLRQEKLQFQGNHLGLGDTSC